MSAINLNTPILTRTGKNFVDNGTDVTLRHILFMVIDSPLEEDKNLTSAQKLKLAQLGVKISRAEDEVTLSASDVTTLLDRAVKITSVVVYGQVVEALDPNQLN